MSLNLFLSVQRKKLTDIIVYLLIMLLLLVAIAIIIIQATLEPAYL